MANHRWYTEDDNGNRIYKTYERRNNETVSVTYVITTKEEVRQLKKTLYLYYLGLFAVISVLILLSVVIAMAVTHIISGAMTNAVDWQTLSVFILSVDWRIMIVFSLSFLVVLALLAILIKETKEAYVEYIG